MNQFFDFTEFFRQNFNQSWKPIAKTAFGFIFIGILIYFLREVIIGILSAVLIGIGIYLLYIAFKIWHSKRIQ